LVALGEAAMTKAKAKTTTLKLRKGPGIMIPWKGDLSEFYSPGPEGSTRTCQID
jgi:hypothetical protein